MRDWTLVAEGRLEGTETTARYEQRMVVGESGRESTARLTLPFSHLEDVGALLRPFPALDGLSGSGKVGLSATLTGSGESRRWEVRLRLEELSLAEEETELVIEGLSGTFDWVFAGGDLRSAPRQVLSFRALAWEEEIRTGRGDVEFEVASAGEWRLHRAVVEWAGGELSAGEFAFNPAEPDVTVRLRARGIKLGELLRLVPELQAKGEGIMDGELSLRITSGGLRLEPGHLSLRPGAPGRLQLPARPWFTEGMTSEDPNYDNLRLVERALEDLELRKFRLDFLSEDEDAPLRVNLEGKPLAEGIPAPSVSLTLNVHGPIRELGSWMLSPGVGIGFR